VSPRWTRGWRVAGVVAALLFLLSAAVQHNDPDPLPWMAVYGAAAVLGVVVAWGRGGTRTGVAALLLLGVSVVWLWTLGPAAVRFLATPRPEGVSYAMKAGDVVEEEAREAGGLLLVALWSAAVAGRARRGKLAP
jgi:Transmembrane family 220, helix